MTEELKNLHELITTVRLDIREINTKMDGIKELHQKVERADEIADEALLSTKSAHLRLDKIDKVIFWTATTIIGALILGLIAFILRGGIAIK